MRTVCILGRPNVGKSKLFNRLLGQSRSIVHDRPGVTRDPVSSVLHLSGRDVELVDTGGFFPEKAGGMDSLVAEMVEKTLSRSSLLILVLDAREGLTPADEEIVSALRRRNLPIIAVANKVDPGSMNHSADELLKLGIDPLLQTSAEHNSGVDDLREEIERRLPPPEGSELSADLTTTAIAFVGRPNVGKSSLINRVLNEPRLIVSEVPGTTRDVIDIAVEKGRRCFLLLDTAGVRRRFKVTDDVEKHSAVRSLRAMDRSDVVVLVLDAHQDLTNQDERIASEIIRRGKGLLVVANKWDLFDDHPNTRRRFREDVFAFAPFLRFASLRFTSAKTGLGVDQILTEAWRIQQRATKVFPKKELDRAFHTISSNEIVAGRLGTRLRLFGLTQGLEDRGMVFFVWCNDPRLAQGDFERYWRNAIQELLKLEGVPIRVVFRRRERGSSEPSENSSEEPESTSDPDPAL